MAPLAVVPSTANRQAKAIKLLVAFLCFLGVGAGVKFFLKFYLQWAKLNARRKARKERASKRTGSEPKLMHCTLGPVPDLDMHPEARKAVDEIVSRMNFNFPGTKVQFHAYGSKKQTKYALLTTLQKTDMSFNMSHAFITVSDDITSLKLFLHSNLHKVEWPTSVANFIRPPMAVVELDVELGVALEPKGKEDPVLMIVFIRFKEYVTEDSELYASFEEVVGALNAFPGISAALRVAGYDDLIKEDLRKELMWSDSTLGYTHCFQVAADSPELLKDLQASEAYGKWLAMEKPHFLEIPNFWPPAVVFYNPITVEAKA